MQEITNTADLRKMLLAVIADVRKGEMNYKDANAVAALSASVLQSAKLDFEIMKMGLLDNAKRPKSASLLLNEEKQTAIGTEQEPDEEPDAEDAPEQKEEDANTDDEQDGVSAIRKDAFATRAKWYPKDWQEIKKSLARGIEREEIAEDYGVPVEELEKFIAANGETPGEA